MKLIERDSYIDVYQDTSGNKGFIEKNEIYNNYYSAAVKPVDGKYKKLATRCTYEKAFQLINNYFGGNTK